MRIAHVIMGGLCSADMWLSHRTVPPNIASDERNNAHSAHSGEERRRAASRERVARTSGETFILKVDPKNGGSSHLVFFTADLAPGRVIEAHRHPGSDEILFLQTGTARVHLKDSGRDVHAGSKVFIPADTWISVSNIGNDVISLVSVFSSPGFEDFMRAVSVREGEKSVPLSKAENDEIEKKHSHAVIYKEP